MPHVGSCVFDKIVIFIQEVLSINVRKEKELFLQSATPFAFPLTLDSAHSLTNCYYIFFVSLELAEL